MQQRRLRLGDILDDYCPRERRVTNHAVVAMIEDEVRQTRCTTCDAEHEYKQARVPVSRRRKPNEGVLAELAGRAPSSPGAAPGRPDDSPSEFELSESEVGEPEADLLDDPALSDDGVEDEAPVHDDDGPVHRRLIRATLPRPEGQTPERKAPDFTIRQPSNGRFEPPRKEGRRRARHQPREGGPAHGHPARSGNAPQGQRGSGRHGADPAGHGRHGNRAGQNPGNTAAPRGGRPPGPHHGPRPGGGQGRKRGR